MDRSGSASDYYKRRVALIKMISEQNNLQKEYKEAYVKPTDLNFSSEAGQSQTIGEGDFTGESSDTIVKIPHTDQVDVKSEHAHERAEAVDPAELFLFHSTGVQAKMSEDAVNDFSIVQKNHGLGSTDPRNRYNYNP